MESRSREFIFEFGVVICVAIASSLSSAINRGDLYGAFTGGILGFFIWFHNSYPDKSINEI
jgi:hypothetical protein